MVAAEADPAGILWTHPNGIGFRSGVYGLGLNAHIPTGGYPHSHGLLVKREAEAEPHGYYGYGKVCERMSCEESKNIVYIILQISPISLVFIARQLIF